jgi:succinyl-CoA synthetase alpha subunit/RimJ/RimL family protein N-acetyltransferase
MAVFGEPLTTEAVTAKAVADYPVDEVADVMLRDGSSIRFRPVQQGDREAIKKFYEALSPESITLRFFGTPSIDWVTKWSLDLDYCDRYAIVAEGGPDGDLVAHAGYVRDGERTAEVAFVVADSAQGHGISSLMLFHLAAVARRHGIERFVACVLPSNHRMIDAFRDSGLAVSTRFEDGEVLVALPAAINRAGGTIAGLTAYRSVTEVPEAPELAVVAVPAAQVSAVAAECASAGVRALVVISAGFAEVGEEGLARQRELLEICRGSGMRLVGPNCLGVINTDPAVSLDATFAARRSAAGRIGFLSQSGGLGIPLIEAADRLGLGLSSFVSVGNKADLSGNDLLEYWEEDSATDLILLYLESFGNPRRFARIARRVSARKPIIAVESGRSPAGARAEGRDHHQRGRPRDPVRRRVRI